MTYSMLSGYATQDTPKSGRLNMRFLLLLSVAAIGMTAVQPVDAARPRDKEQDQAWRATRDGRMMPLRDIESRVLPKVGGADYLGPELNGERYRLKFMRQGEVFWVDVDARTGRVVGRSKH
jgi:uncharacterized membrane protein YkoI